MPHARRWAEPHHGEKGLAGGAEQRQLARGGSAPAVAAAVGVSAEGEAAGAVVVGRKAVAGGDEGSSSRSRWRWW